MAGNDEVKLIIGGDAQPAIAAQQKYTAGLKKMQSDTSDVFATIKSNWLATSAAIYGVYETAQKAIEMWGAGAKVLQIEDIFRATTAAAGQSSDAIIESLKKVTNGTVDTNELMQKAMKGMSAVNALSSEQIIEIGEVARVAARRTGTDVSDAYDRITDAVETMRPRALVALGLVSKEQYQLINSAQSAGVQIDLLKVILGNYNEQLEKLGPTMENQYERWQQFKAGIKETYEAMAKLVAKTLDYMDANNRISLATRRTMHETYDSGHPGTIMSYGQDPALTTSARPNQNAIDARNAELAKAQAEKFAPVREAFNLWTVSIQNLNPALSQTQRELARINEEGDKWVRKGISSTEVEAWKARARAYSDAARDSAAEKEIQDRVTKGIIEQGKAEQEMAMISLQSKGRLLDLDRNYQIQLAQMQLQTGSGGMTEQGLIELRAAAQIQNLEGKKAEIDLTLQQKGYSEDFWYMDKQMFALLKQREEIEANIANVTDKKALDTALNRYNIETKSLEVMREIYGTTPGAGDQYYKASLELIQKQASHMNADDETKAIWTQREIERAEVNRAKMSNSLTAGMKAAHYDLYKSQLTWGQAGYETWVSIYKSMETTFSSVLYDGMQGDLKSFQDYFSAFAQSIEKEFADLCGKMVVKWAESMLDMSDSDSGSGFGGLFGGLGSIFSSLFSGADLWASGLTIAEGDASSLASVIPAFFPHGGGIVGQDDIRIQGVSPGVFAGAPRLHRGLMPDEFPAILQKGEKVIPKSKVGASGTVINNHYHTYHFHGSVTTLKGQARELAPYIEQARRDGVH